MDYEKKYKESMAKMSTFLAKHDGFTISKDGEMYKELSEIFDELKESEDERIRKALIEGFNRFDKSAIWYNGITNGQILSWLEKQGEHKCDCKYVGCHVNNMKRWCHKKQSEILYEKCNTKCSEYLKQGEQNLADKAELKFKVGDWITDGNITIQIEAIKNDCYLYCGDCALYSTKTADKVYHLWTIQDVKDGDILAYGNDIVIFKENNYNPKDQSGCMFVYCAFNKCGYWYEIGGINPTYYKPATKEQRDTLMKAMADARYEWDAEKKELKKIEQNLDWGEEDEKKLNYLIAFLQNSTMTNNALSATNEGIEEWLKSLKDRYTWKPSEEQMLAINTAINVLGKETISGKCLIELQEQLKKLMEE